MATTPSEWEERERRERESAPRDWEYWESGVPERDEESAAEREGERGGEEEREGEREREREREESAAMRASAVAAACLAMVERGQVS